MNKKQGLLIVFEGIDGSGKTTQINLLARTLNEKNIDFEVISFPQFGQNEYAKKIFDYLSGKFGNLKEVDPYEMAKLYAGDRKTLKEKIEKWLAEGKLVIANRYVSSSKAHLAANLPEEKRADFIKWIDQLEYNENNMPKEDLTILLNVNPQVTQKNVMREHDIHEESLKHLQKTHDIFLELAKQEKNWVVVDCMSNFQMKSPQEINKEIRDILYSQIF